MEKNTLLIENVLLNEKIADIFIEGNIISKICFLEEEGRWKDSEFAKKVVVDRVIDASKKAAMPGFINMHTHSAMNLMKGIREDDKLLNWLDAIWKVEKKLNPELIYWGTKLACLEMIKTGTTTFNDQYWMLDSSVKAVEEMGLRSVQSYVMLNMFDADKSEEQKQECEQMYNKSKAWGKLNTFAVSIHSIYTVDEDLIKWTSNFVKQHNLLLHIHLSETEQENLECLEKHNLSPTAYLDSLGVLGPHVLAAHGVWLSDEDIEILSKANVKIIHNINSNLKLASGYRFKYQELKDANITVCIGTDGAASSNNLDMLEAAKTSSLLQKAWREDPSALPLEELIKMITLNGALSLRLNTGQIKEGCLADIQLIDINNYAFVPNINFLANLVYSANSSFVDTLICDGKILMEGRKVAKEQEILDNVNKIYNKLLK